MSTANGTYNYISRSFDEKTYTFSAKGKTPMEGITTTDPGAITLVYAMTNGVEPKDVKVSCTEKKVIYRCTIEQFMSVAEIYEPKTKKEGK